MKTRHGVAVFVIGALAASVQILTPTTNASFTHEEGGSVRIVVNLDSEDAPAVELNEPNLPLSESPTEEEQSPESSTKPDDETESASEIDGTPTSDSNEEEQAQPTEEETTPSDGGTSELSGEPTGTLGQNEGVENANAAS